MEDGYSRLNESNPYTLITGCIAVAVELSNETPVGPSRRMLQYGGNNIPTVYEDYAFLLQYYLVHGVPQRRFPPL